jgi:effector-binding domain-containing protein
MFKLPLTVSRQITIAKPLSLVRQVLLDFKIRDWSPWLCMDKQTQVDSFGELGRINSGFRWQSQWVGAGQLTLESISDNTLQLQLEFFKPWHSVANVTYLLVPLNDNSTELTWSMTGSLPIWLFFMQSMMQAYIGMDYQRGLLMLKDYLESGHVFSDTEVCGVVDVPSVDYVGVRRLCTTDTIGPDMQMGCGELLAQFGQSGLQQTGVPFTIYHDWNIKTGRCDYTFALQIEPGQTVEFPNLIQSNRPSVKALKLTHTGDYKHLGNAWATAYSRIQNDKTLKQNKKQPGFEIYVNDLSVTEAKDLLTEVYVPIL